MISTKRRFDILARDGFRCVYCGTSSMAGAVLEVDHVIPVVLGGTDDDANLVTACWACNNGKRARTVEAAAAEVAPPIGATCLTPLLIASKAAMLGCTYRHAREQLELAGHDVPPFLPHHRAIAPTEENRQYVADMLESALS